MHISVIMSVQSLSRRWERGNIDTCVFCISVLVSCVMSCNMDNCCVCVSVCV